MELARRHPEIVTGHVLSGCSGNFRGLLGLSLKLVSALMQATLLHSSAEVSRRLTHVVKYPCMLIGGHGSSYAGRRCRSQPALGGGGQLIK
jgi:hypothetical protein